MKTQITLKNIVTILLIACAVFAVTGAVAETTSPRADAGEAAPPPEAHWEDAGLPNGQSLGELSTDTVLPLPMWLGGFVDPETGLQYVDVVVTSESSADPVEGVLSYHQGLGLVLWTPSAELAPQTAYTVTVVVDNEGLGLLGFGGGWPNITAQFTFSTGAGVLPLAPQPVIDDMILSEVSYQEWVYCPAGEVYCEGPGQCSQGVPYNVPYWNVELRWRDGEDVGTQLFFAYNAADMDTQALVGSLSGADVLSDTHLMNVHMQAVEGTDRVCVELQTTDLRSVPRGTAATDFKKLVRCAEHSGVVVSDPSAILARCEPDPNACVEPDADGCTDVSSSGTDATSSSGADTTSQTDTVGGGGGDEDAGACGCSSARRPEGAPPIGLLAGIAAAAGAGLLLTGRRRATKTSV